MEKLMIEMVEVEVSFLDRTILDIPRLAVHQFDRIGIIGKNGAGKSTLLKLMSGLIKPDKGTIKRYAEPSYFDQLEMPEEIATEAGLDYEWLGRLSVPASTIEQVTSYSGGEQTRLKLAQIFSTYGELLLLDEPTTHLDADGVGLFIDHLLYYYGAMIIVSHDRHVLDKLVTTIWEIEDSCVTEYSGNYTYYTEQKSLQRAQQQEQYEHFEKEKSRLLKAAADKMKKAERITQANGHISKREVNAKANKMFMTKSKDTSQKAVQRAAKAIEQRVQQLEQVAAPKQERALSFQQPQALKLHNKFPVMGERVTIQLGGKSLLLEAGFQFQLEKKIAITGANGSGKSSLLRHILAGGEGITVSPKAAIGCYEQLAYHMDSNETVLGFIKARSDYSEDKIRAALHAMNFTGSDLVKNLRQLSGGERIRLQLCQLFLGRYNILILDEPTNFLDLYCIEALQQFLHGYGGTVILVSHDRQFVDAVADVVYSIEGQKLVLKRSRD